MPKMQLSKLMPVFGWRWRALVLAALPAVAYSSCGDHDFNLYASLGAKDLAVERNQTAQLEEARTEIDSGEYAKASEILLKLIEQEATDSDEARLLYAAALLGDAGLDIWSIIADILNETGKNSNRSGGIDTIFNTFSDTALGTGSERTEKTAALAAAINTLSAAPNAQDKKILNTICLLAGMLAAPTLADASAAVATVSTALQQISASATSNGASCPNISLLDTGLSGIQATAANFNLILSAAANCPFIDLNSATAMMNQVELSLSRLRANSDKGCVLPTCPSSQPNCAASFPSCVQSSLGVGQHPEYANNGRIEACEIVLHCTDAAECFDG